MITKAKTIHKETESIDSEIVIKAQNISKKYRLYGSHIHRLKEIFHPLKKKYHKEFWALQDISFEIRKGETIGFIGRNGSGKSTILQILAGILTPTDGNIEINGKISALLELGTGFNPELTGRENVYVNGKIMGYSKKNIDQRLPLIEEFADIGDFIDQPVRVYSSGMFVRLAFATAINVDPDILIIDEALAVGDAKFQQKCFGKFQQFKKEGKTIIFVTHSTEMVIRHCDRAILLDNGHTIEIGNAQNVTDAYLSLLFTGEVAALTVQPALLKENYKSYNVVQYKKIFYGLPQSLGEINFEDSKSLDSLNNDDKCFSADTEAKIIEMIDKFLPTEASNTDDLQNDELPDKELCEFMDNLSSDDMCCKRNNYNKNEYRFGNRRAEIIDYLIANNGKFNPPSFTSGDSIELYTKVKFNDFVELPMLGFSIKTIDGITIYGSNTRFSEQVVRCCETNEIVVFKFTIKLSLIPGDFFIELGVAEKLLAEDEAFDIRKNIIHISVLEKNIFEGVAELGSSFEEVIIR